jgi:SAM-dependent methyltransferase
MPTAEQVALPSSARVLVALLEQAIDVTELYAGGADIYDAVVHGDESELPEVLAQSRHLDGDVLDLGCGSGRLTLPFAARNRRVLALDTSTAMLDLLRRRLALLPSRAVRLVEPLLADMADAPLGDRVFDIVMLGTSNVTLLDPTARREVFRSVRDHLSEDGLFFVTLLNILPSLSAVENIRIVPTVDLDGLRWIVTLIDEHEPDSSDRRVAILAQCVSDRERPIRLLHSQPRVLAEEDVLDDLRNAGLELTRREVVGEPEPGREVVLLTVRIAR